MAQEKLQVILELLAGQYKREAKQASTATGQITSSMGKADTATGKLGSRFSGVAGAAKAFLGTAAVGAVAGFAKSTIDAASRLEQAIGGTEAVFGDASAAIDRFAENSAESVGLAESEFRTATTLIGGQLKRMTGDVDFAAESAIRLTEIGADLAATYGGTTQEAVEAFAAALRGEADPAERFNLDLKISAVNAKAVELGLARTTKEVDNNAKAQALLALVLEQSADAQGQFAREADTVAGQQQRLNAELENTKAEIGEQLLPVWGQLLGAFKDSLPVLKDVSTALIDVSAGAKEGGPEVGAWGRVLEGLISPGRAAERLALDFKDALDGEAEAAGDATNVISEHSDAIHRATSGYDTLVPVAEDADRALFNMSQRGNAADVLKRIGDEAGTGAPSVQDLADALANVRTELLKAADPAFAAISAQQDANAAIQAVADAQAAFAKGEGSLDDVNAAAAEAAEKILEADAATATLGANADRHVRPLESALSVIEEHVDGVDLSVQGLLEHLGLINGETFSFFIDAQMDPADRALLNSVRAGGSGAGPTPGSNGAGAGIQFRAGGGRFGRGPLVVGEDGPELRFEDSSGFIASNQDFRRLIQAMSQTSSSGGDTVIHLHGSGIAETDIGTLVAVAGLQRRIETARRA